MSTPDAAATPARESPAGDEAATGRLTSGLALLVLWMLSVFGFGGVVVAAVAGASLPVLAVALVAWLGPGLLAAPLMLYDAWTLRGTPAADGFRFDPFWTSVVMLLIYPMGLPVYVVTRLQGSYVATLGLDTDEMGFGDELEFGLEDLVNPAADGVPSVWPAMVALFVWLGVLLGYGGALLAYVADGSTTMLLATMAAVGAVTHLVAVPLVLLDVHVVAKTGHFTREEALGLAAATAVFFPLALVAYLPYRLHATYGG